MFGATSSTSTSGPDLKGPLSTSQPSEEFKEEHARVKHAGGRPPGSKNKPKPGASQPETRTPNATSAPARWTPVSAGAFIQALHCIPAGLEGNDEWLYTPDELAKASPISAEIFNELLPADSYWLKLVVFAGVVLPIEFSKFKKWQERRKTKLAAKPNIPAAGTGAPAAGLPAGPTNPIGTKTSPKPVILPGQDFPVAPGVVLPKS